MTAATLAECYPSLALRVRVRGPLLLLERTAAATRTVSKRTGVGSTRAGCAGTTRSGLGTRGSASSDLFYELARMCL